VSLYPHGVCWFALDFEFKRSFFGVQRHYPEWMINVRSNLVTNKYVYDFQYLVVAKHTCIYMCVFWVFASSVH
jgi:hypothetical protein